MSITWAVIVVVVVIIIVVIIVIGEELIAEPAELVAAYVTGCIFGVVGEPGEGEWGVGGGYGDYGAGGVVD